MTKIPTAEDWQKDPGTALENALAIAKATGAHGDATTQGIALGIAAKVVAAAAPIVGQVVGGPLGALAGAAVAQVAAGLEADQRNSLATLTPAQIALIDQAVAIGALAAAQKKD